MDHSSPASGGEAADETVAKPGRRRTAIAVAIVLVASVVPYYRAKDAGFFADDHLIVRKDTRVTDHGSSLVRLFSEAFGPALDKKDDRRRYYRPLVTASLRLNHLLSADRPLTYHIFNLLLHALFSLTVLFVSRSLFGLPPNLAFAVALLFAVHPVHVSSVMWIAGRTDLLGGLFVLWALLLHVRSQQRGGDWRLRLASAGCFLLALASKEVAVFLPLIALLASYSGTTATRREASERPDWIYLGTCALVVLVFFVVHRSLTASPGGIGLGGAAGAPLALLRYLKDIVIPLDLHGFQITAPSVSTWQLVAAAGIVLVALGLLVRSRAQRPLFLGGSWYLVFLLPGLGLLPLAGYVGADHLQYIASMGAIIVAVYLASRALRLVGEARKRAAVGTALLIAASGLLTAKTVALAHTWSDEASIYSALIARYPRFADGRVSLSKLLLARGDPAGAYRICQAGLKHTPKSGKLWSCVGQLSIKRGRLGAAERALKKAIHFGAVTSETHNNLANCYLVRGALAEARHHYQRALELDGKNYQAMYNLGITLGRLGRRAEAVVWYRRFIAQAPERFARQKAALRRQLAPER